MSFKQAQSRLTHHQITKAIKLYTEDPLLWNPSILHRIFDLSEDECRNLLRYVQPMVMFGSRETEVVKQLQKTSYVVDVERLQNDKRYFPIIQALVFPKKTGNKDARVEDS